MRTIRKAVRQRPSRISVITQGLLAFSTAVLIAYRLLTKDGKFALPTSGLEIIVLMVAGVSGFFACYKLVVDLTETNDLDERALEILDARIAEAEAVGQMHEDDSRLARRIGPALASLRVPAIESAIETEAEAEAVR